MRVLHLDSGREMRGGQWQVLRLIEGLAAAGVESTLLARKGGELFRRACEHGWQVEPLGFLKTLSARKFDLVHAHDARGHTMGAIAGRAPLVVSRRVAFPVKSRWKYRQPARFLAVSEFVKSVLSDGGVEGERVSVVYDGVPVLGTAHGNTVLSLFKGAELAGTAAGIAGVELEISRDLEHDLMHAGMLVYVTDCEGLGSGVLLAMSAGVPVIASNVGGLREIVQHGENGLLVENDAKAFASAILRLCTDRALAARLGAAGRQMVLERFTVERMVHKTLDVYRQVLA
jgi:glycosyltransferase involved in cell wall biosynthesis